jgi:hypothetical protein
MIFHKSLCGGVASAGSWRRRNGQKTRPILASSSPRSSVPSARPAIFTRRSTAPAATGVSARWAAALYGEALITLAADDDACRHGACSRAPAIARRFGPPRRLVHSYGLLLTLQPETSALHQCARAIRDALAP